MVRKKSKKVTGKAKAKATTPATPPKPQYEDVLKARHEMDAADEQVIIAGRALNRAKSDFADSAIRRAAIDKTGAALVDARAKAEAAVAEFKRVKKAAG